MALRDLELLAAYSAVELNAARWHPMLETS